jgi:hypothetical protein
MHVLLQEGVRAGAIDAAGYVVLFSGLAMVVAWWAYLYR